MLSGASEDPTRTASSCRAFLSLISLAFHDRTALGLISELLQRSAGVWAPTGHPVTTHLFCCLLARALMPPDLLCNSHEVVSCQLTSRRPRAGLWAPKVGAEGCYSRACSGVLGRCWPTSVAGTLPTPSKGMPVAPLSPAAAAAAAAAATSPPLLTKYPCVRLMLHSSMLFVQAHPSRSSPSCRLLAAAQASPSPAAAAPAAATIVAAPDLRVEPALNGHRFVWTQSWYPVVSGSLAGSPRCVPRRSTPSSSVPPACPPGWTCTPRLPLVAPQTALDYLDPARPHQATLLGHSLVVWRDADGQWRCFQDSCPHRAAPLSGKPGGPPAGWWRGGSRIAL